MKQINNPNFSSEIPGPDWTRDRANYIGGSSVACIMGESDYETSLQLWMRKKGHLPPIESTEIMSFGNAFEPIMATHFENLTGLKTRRVNEPFVHKKYPFLRANIDRQILNGEGVDGTGVLELKTTNSHRLKSLDGEYPVEWFYQLQWYLNPEITNYKYGFLFVYERDTCKFYEPILIKRDEALIAEMQDKLVGWWQKHMVEGVPPEPANGEDALLLYPDANDGKIVEASAEDVAFYEELVKVRQKLNSLEFEKDVIEALLKNSIGDGERLVAKDLGDLITWKNQTTNRLDTTALKQRYPALCKKFIKQTSTRRFVVK